MARPRTPTKVLEMRGAFANHPKRRRERAGEPDIAAGLGAAPEVLDEAERARWNEIKKWGPWLNVSHRIIVEQTCRMWMLERRGKAKSADSKLLQSNLTRLGMTPADQSRVRMADAPKHESKLAQLLRRPA